MRFLLDTATFIWAAASPERISKTAMSALQSERAVREMSSLSLSEIAIKLAKGKLAFSREDALTGIAGSQDTRSSLHRRSCFHPLHASTAPQRSL